MPINLTALEQRNHAQIIVAFACELGYKPDPINLVGVVEAVTSRRSKLHAHRDGPAFAVAIRRAAGELRHAIDSSAEMVFAGRCTICEAQLSTTRDSETTRCRMCGA